MTEDGFVGGIGAANVDFHGQSHASLVLRDSNPGAVELSAGGVTRNILENLARLGERVSLFSAMGDDLLGRFLREHCDKLGIDTQGVLVCPEERSSCYMALLDSGGDMFAALSDMSVLQRLTPEQLRGQLPRLRQAAAAVCDACLPAETLDWLSSGALRGIPLFVDPVSTAYARRLRPFAGRFSCIKPNRMELQALTDCDASDGAGLERGVDRLLEQGTGCVVVSLGSGGCYWADQSGARFYRSLRPVEKMVNATGAGDAFMAGLIHGFCRGLSPEQTADTALAAGVIAVTSADTVSRAMTRQHITEILEVYS